MEDLLASVLDAHGGLDSWRSVTGLTARLSLGGPFWAARGWPDVYADQTVVIEERVDQSFAAIALDIDTITVERA